MIGISNTIVINFGQSKNDNNNEEGDMQKSLMNNVPALRKKTMGNKDNDDEEDDGANIFINKEAALHKEVMEKKIVSKKYLQSRL